MRCLSSNPEQPAEIPIWISYLGLRPLTLVMCFVRSAPRGLDGFRPTLPIRAVSSWKEEDAVY